MLISRATFVHRTCASMGVITLSFRYNRSYLPFLMSTPSRFAFVTGASRGIGEAVALRLAEDGMDVAVNDIASMAHNLAAVVEKIRQRGRRAIAVVGDVSDEDEVKAMMDKVVENMGGIDVMVANAGILLLKPVLETSMEEYDRIMSVNARATFLCFKYAAIEMIKQGRGGRIIGACSVAGKTGFNKSSVYCASKFAVRALTQTCAIEWAKHNITVNSYAPGLICTPMVLDPNNPSDNHASAFKEAAGVPTIPDAEPSVIGGLVSYLARPESHFVTGQCININGGCIFD